MIKFSIIVPIYKVEKYLDECINSIINQKYKNLEIILVEDGSPDNCSTICDRYSTKDKRIKVIHKKNGGLVSARKAGLEVASGDYICCVDGDDYLDNNYIQIFNDILEKNNVDIICSGYKLSMPQKIVKKNLDFDEGYYDEDRIRDEIFPYLINITNKKKFLPTLWGKTFKREIYKKYQMSVPNSVSMGEDGAVIVPMMTSVRSLYIINENSYNYRYNNTSMTKGHKVLNWKSQYDVINHIKINLENYDYYNFESQIDKRITKGFFSTALSQFYRKEKYGIIKQDILDHIDISLYRESISRVNFSSFKGLLMKVILKKRLIFIIYLISKIK